MASTKISEALENIYASLQEDNKDIDTHIAHLKSVLSEEGEKTVAVEAARLAQNNRQGRKMMESYFRKRGVSVTFV